jgi:two-component system, sensor histidine kinase and response regulator
MKQKVLIAEDEPALLESYSELVARLGYECLTALDGDEALVLARQHTPDLVVTDFMMPGRTGLQVIRALKQDPLLALIPTILITAGRPREQELSEAWLALHKPVNIEQFERAVQEGLQWGKGRLHQRRSTASAPDDESPINLAREEMLNWVSHEIRSPISAAMTATELALRDLRSQSNLDASTFERRLNVVSRQLTRMDELVSSILDAAQLHDGKIKLDLEDVALGAWLNGIMASWRELNPEYEFVVRDGSGVVVRADRERLRQIVDNLISNAIKYGKPAKRVITETALSGDHVIIRVTDEGPGIPPEQLATIFDRFQRVAGQGGRGHGLGLYIAAALARLHGGVLSVESEVGRGSTFTLSLPTVA